MAGTEDWFANTDHVPRVNAAESILADLREAISEGSVAVGSRLPAELELARHYGVSRPVVREALRSLQALGLTQTRTGSGTYVVSKAPRPPQRFGHYSTRDLMESRPSIEIPCARLASLRRTDAEAEELLTICDQMEQESRPQAWVRLDSGFHVAVAKASKNAVFGSVVSDIREALTEQSAILNLVAHRQDPSNIEHRNIAQAIGAQEPERAAKAMALHLGFVESVVKSMVENSD